MLIIVTGDGHGEAELAFGTGAHRDGTRKAFEAGGSLARPAR